ncbi:transcription repressor OFP13-like, partial [Camellia sinensis]|uniref:transcription repressor OFP13-like n=1 Tax=Camellia sinensis TaxID=4442 RepID=UPI001035CC0E
MGKKMKFPSLFKNKEARHPWQWASCTQPRTLSFRAAATGDDMFKTVNSVFFDLSDGVETPLDSWFTNSSESASFSTQSEDIKGESTEMIIRGVQSERLFFEPGDTRSILTEEKSGEFPFKESVAMAMESEDPYEDFKRSMEEMVESHGLKDWECLEELLGWYLRVNGKVNHGFIVGAFVDLLVAMASSTTSTSCCEDSTTTTTTTTTTT